MSPTVKKIEAEIKKLDPHEQSELYDRLGDLVYGEAEEDPAFIATLKRRVAEIESGKVQGIPVEETYQKIKRQLS